MKKYRKGNVERPIVLLTGANGFVGFRILTDLLESNLYTVRIAVRSEAKAKAIRANSTFISKLSSPKDVEFVIVPDITCTGAYSNAIKDVKYVIHVASPVPRPMLPMPAISKMRHNFIEPAVQGTLEILRAAAAEPRQSVSRVVMTGDVVALVPLEVYQGRCPSDDPITETTRIPDPQAEKTDVVPASAIEAYFMSKVASLAAAERFMRDHAAASARSAINASHSPSSSCSSSTSSSIPSSSSSSSLFSLVHIHPSYVIGRNALAHTPAEVMNASNMSVLSQVLPNQPLSRSCRPGLAVHIADVSRVHILSMDLPLSSGQYISLIANVNVQWEDVNYISARLFPGATKRGILTNDGLLETVKGLTADISETMARLKGFKFQSLKYMVHSVVEQYLQVSGGLSPSHSLAGVIK